MKSTRLILVVCCLAGAATATLAQVGGFTVVVTDEEGDPLPAATVTISHETGFIKTTAESTDAQGTVRFPVLRPGAGYRIEVTFPGFSPLRYDDLRVRINERQTVRVQMIEELREEVRVTAERGVVDLDKTETSTKFTDDFIADLPVLDRFYQNVLVMAPGVQDADGDGNPNVHGSRTRDFRATVGSVSNVDPLTGQWLSRINPNSIEEMEIITAGAGVEFGRAQGGFANIIQKQGSNTHEGIVEFHYQTSDLDGDGSASTALPTAEFETVQPGFQFSGPVIRDRLWYRVSYEKRDVEEPVNVISDVVVFTEETETRDAQLTFQASPRNKLALKYRSDPAELTNFGVSSRVPIENSRKLGRDVDTWDLTWTAAQSPRILIESTVAWQDINLTENPSVSGVDNKCIPSSVVGFLRAAPCLNLDIDRISGSYNESNSDQRQRFTFKTQATIYGGRFLGATHQIKLGFSAENERYFRELSRTPSITYEEEFPFGGIPFAIVLADIDVPVSDRVQATGTNWAVYVEDQFKPMGNLTFTLGARVDREETDSQGWRDIDFASELSDYETNELDIVQKQVFGLTRTVFSDPDNWEYYFTGFENIGSFRDQISRALCEGVPPSQLQNCLLTTSSSVLVQLQDETTSKRLAEGITLRNTNFSPYFAVAWDPWHDGKTAIKGTVGRHYNTIPLIVPLQELEPIRTTVEYRADLDNFQTDINGLISSTPTVITVDDDLRTPYQDEYTLSFERDLWGETSILLTYVNRHFKDQLQDRNINIATGDYGVCAPVQVQDFFNVNVTLEPGEGQVLRDPWTQDVYFDTDPGIGDGWTDGRDDCGGVTFFDGGTDPFGSDALRIQSPDGLPDLYTQNPFWGGVFEIGNYNEAEYEALVLELVRRRFRGWEMNASYTYSEAVGDGEDFLQEIGNDPSLIDSVRGFQSYDQRHVVKLNATAATAWGIRLGTSVTWQTGLPYSILLEETSDDILPPSTSVFLAPGSRLRQSYPTGVRNDQRNTSYWNVDLKATKEILLGRRMNLQISAEVFNALNDDTYMIYNPFFENGVRINGVNEAVRRFGRRWQLGARLAF
jgi:hypothetical protein